MFALIGYGWNIVVPLAPFAFDTDFQARKLENASRHCLFELDTPFQTVFPGTWINRHKIAAKEEETRNSICMSDAGSIRRYNCTPLNLS